jgi:hypothetical protein
MAKRFTDTQKWEKPWFRKLPNKYKLLWIYITDRCDIAGVWYADFELASIFIGEKIKEEEALLILDKQIEVRGGRWLINDFIQFQYGSLSDSNRMHNAVRERIDEFNSLKKEGASEILQGVSEGHICPLDTLKDKDKVKEIKNLNSIVKDTNLNTTTTNSKFTPPTLEEVKKYCDENKYYISAEMFHNHYEKNGWMVGRNRMKDWRAGVRYWVNKAKEDGTYKVPQIKKTPVSYAAEFEKSVVRATPEEEAAYLKQLKELTSNIGRAV